MYKDKSVEIEKLRAEREVFWKEIKFHQKKNKIKNIDVADGIGIAANEYTNMMTGHQRAIPSKGILNFEDFKKEVTKFLGI